MSIADDLKAAEKLLIAASIGSCTCNTKSAEILWHNPSCRFVTLSHAIDLVEESAATLAERDAEIERLQKAVVWGFYEERVPQFSQGPCVCELASEVTAEEVTNYVNKIDSLQAETERLRSVLLRYRERLNVAGEYLCAHTNDKAARSAYAAVLYVQSSLKLDAEGDASLNPNGRMAEQPTMRECAEEMDRLLRNQQNFLKNICVWHKPTQEKIAAIYTLAAQMFREREAQEAARDSHNPFKGWAGP